MAPRKQGTKSLVRAIVLTTAEVVRAGVKVYRAVDEDDDEDEDGQEEEKARAYDFKKSNRTPLSAADVGIVELTETTETEHSTTKHFTVKRTDDWPFPNAWLVKSTEAWPFAIDSSRRSMEERHQRVVARLRRAESLMHRAWRDVPMGRFNAVQGTAISEALRGTVPQAALRWRRLVRRATNTWRSLWTPARPALPKAGPYR